MFQVDREVFVSDVRPLVESYLSCGWQNCDQNMLLVVLATDKRKLVSLFVSCSLVCFCFIISCSNLYDLF